MRTHLLILCLGLAACASVEGAPTSQSAPVAQATEAPGSYPISVDLPADVYRLDPRHANVTFRIRHEDLSWYVGRFDDKSAELTLDPEDPSRSRLTASVGADSVDTGLVGDEQRTFDHQIGRALGAATTPRITFTSTSIERTGRFTARITGDLAMNGQTHPAVLDATFNAGRIDPLRGAAMVLAFSARGVIDRTQWGVSQWRAFSGDNVEIVIEAELVKS